MNQDIIEEAEKEFINCTCEKSLWQTAFIEGAKWYRQQLKLK